jgi:hypothetical protein
MARFEALARRPRSVIPRYSWARLSSNGPDKAAVAVSKTSEERRSFERNRIMSTDDLAARLLAKFGGDSGADEESDAARHARVASLKEDFDAKLETVVNPLFIDLQEKLPQKRVSFAIGSDILNRPAFVFSFKKGIAVSIAFHDGAVETLSSDFSANKSVVRKDYAPYIKSTADLTEENIKLLIRQAIDDA